MSPIREDVIVIGTGVGREDLRLRDFLTRTAQPYEWVEAGSPRAAEVLSPTGVTAPRLPAIVERGELIEAATVERVVEAWRATEPPKRSSYDLAIIGAGPAGLAAAVYAASDGLSTLVVDAGVPGGQASHTSLIENFFGFPEGIGGAELSRLAGRQAERFGAELVFLRPVTAGRPAPGGLFSIEVEGGYEIEAAVVIASPGMDWRRLEAPGVAELVGRGVLYGAGRSEAAHCAGEEVVVVGAGNSAGQAALDLAAAGARVRMLVRGESLGRSMSAYLVERIGASERVEVRLRTEVEAADERDGRLASVTVRGPGGARETIGATSMFLCLGGVPRTGWAAGAGVRLDRAGYVLTGPDLLEGGERPAGWPLDRDPLALETSVPGLFAAGDVRHGSAKRVAGAVGEGAMAVALAHRRLAELERG